MYSREFPSGNFLFFVVCMIRVYSMLDIKLNRGLLDNIMLLGLHHAVEPLEAGAERENWEIP